MGRDEDEDEDALVSRADRAEIADTRDGEPPVVARMVIEIRSDGSRTIARGALEDLASGEKVAIEAHGRSPMSLALGLARSMMNGPSLARTAARKLLGGPKKKH